MAIIQGDVIGGSAGFYPKEIEQSLRFNDNDSAYLSWTPASTGNRKTWTFSTWVKRGNIGTGAEQFLLSARPTSTPYGQFYFSTTDFLWIEDIAGVDLRTSQVFRDVSSWYHIVLVADTSNATSSERIKLYVNGERVVSFTTATYPAQNADTTFNSAIAHGIGVMLYNTTNSNLDGYLAETHFTDGTAYDATAFGEFKNGVWVAKEFTGSYGTNGFYLPFRNDYTVEGFSATTYTGNGSTQYIGGVGFEPDLVWIKSRSFSNNHHLFDSVRGHSKILRSSATDAESTLGVMTSFDSDGFTVAETGGNNATNDSGSTFVAWCWDAGTGSPVSNTDGSITSTVKANPDRGFSVVSWDATSTNTDTVGHGLSQTPEIRIDKNRDNTEDWWVYTDVTGSYSYLRLNTTGAATSYGAPQPTSSVFTTHSGATPGAGYVSYCFHSVSGYSKMGSYTGTGASGNTVTTGFKPAVLMIKKSSGTSNWLMLDSTRDPSDASPYHILYPNLSNAEDASGGFAWQFTETGFSIDTTDGEINGSGATYIYMAFADTREAAFWLDDSGNNNDWENNGLTESDISLDSPTNNFATLNPLQNNLSGTSTLSQGNLRIATAVSGRGTVPATVQIPTQDAWYGECFVENKGSALPFFGLSKEGGKVNFYGDGLAYWANGSIYNNGATTSVATYTTGDIVSLAYNAGTGAFTFYKNGASVHSGTFSGTSLVFAIQDNTDSYGSTLVANFGQDSSFAGNKTPQGYTDANGRGDFYYAPPAGYLALCTANLPEPAIGPNSASTSDEHFNTVLYTGNGVTNAITGVGFQPDTTWIKVRSGVADHNIMNSVAGLPNRLRTNTTGAEDTGFVTSFDSDGFTITNGGLAVNQSGQTYVAWNWKANGSGVSNTDGSITSTVSANVDAGFSIVSYTGTNSTQTIGHGLSQAPEVIIHKYRDTATNWYIYHKDIGNTGALLLQATNATYTSSLLWNNTSPTDTVFTAGSYTNYLSGGNIAYCFHSVPQFSKCFSYTGNGSTDGTFVFLDFEPSWILIKRTDSTGHWWIYDSERDTYNELDSQLYANLSNAEYSGTDVNLDFLSNGFKLRDTHSYFNASGGSYIGIAFAKNPLKYSNAR